MPTRLLAAAFFASIALPAIAASVAPPEYRECMRSALGDRERALIDSLRQYNDGQEQALEDRRNRYIEAYDAETDQEIRDRIRDADREYGRRMTDLRDERRDRDRDANRTYGDRKGECRDLRRQVERQNRVTSRPTTRPTYGDCGERYCLELR
jgi:hypothetical protein